MKKVFLFLSIIALVACNNSGDCGCDDVERFYAPQTGLYWYMITKNTSPVTYFYATSATPLTSATQVGPNDWNVSQGVPRELTAAGVDTLGVENVLLRDLPYNLQTALQ